METSKRLELSVLLRVAYDLAEELRLTSIAADIKQVAEKVGLLTSPKKFPGEVED